MGAEVGPKGDFGQNWTESECFAEKLTVKWSLWGFYESANAVEKSQLFLPTGLLFGLSGWNKKVEKIQETTNKLVKQLNDSLWTLRALPNGK